MEGDVGMMGNMKVDVNILILVATELLEHNVFIGCVMCLFAFRSHNYN